MNELSIRDKTVKVLRAGPATISEIANRIGHSRQGVARVMKKLAAEGEVVELGTKKVGGAMAVIWSYEACTVIDVAMSTLANRYITGNMGAA